MKPDLYQRVALRRDVTDHRLKSGDVAVLVDESPTPPAASRVSYWRSSTPSARAYAPLFPGFSGVFMENIIDSYNVT